MTHADLFSGIGGFAIGYLDPWHVRMWRRLKKAIEEVCE